MIFNNFRVSRAKDFIQQRQEEKSKEEEEKEKSKVGNEGKIFF